jgi:hypothetical protein
MSGPKLTFALPRMLLRSFPEADSDTLLLHY